MRFTEDDVKKVVDTVISMPVFAIDGRENYLQNGRYNYYELLTIFMNDFDEFLTKYQKENNIEKMDAVNFVEALHSFFANGYETKDGEREYSFAYDGNSGGLKHYNPNEEEPLKPNSKNRSKILSHTFMSLVVPKSGSTRNAICSGYTELACVMASLYGYECVPLIAMCQIDGGPNYDFAHYLCALDDDGKPILIDLQQIVTQKGFAQRDNPNLSSDELFADAKERMRKFHCDLLFINPNTNEFAMFNENKLIHGGLGEDIVKLVKDKVDIGRTDPLSFALDENGKVPSGIARVIDVQKIEGSPNLTEAIRKIVTGTAKHV